MAWLHVHYNSKVLRMPVAMEVLLPELIDDPQRGTLNHGPYKTLYLLHGKRQDHTSWLRKTSIERHVTGLPLAVIMPQAHLSWYADMQSGRNYFTFITQELPELCERMFNLSPNREDRFIAGLSMGGYGAIKAGLTAYNTFSAAASLSGILDISVVYDRPDPGNISDALGPKESFPGSANDLFAAVESFPKNLKSSFYVCCGTEDERYSQAVKFRDFARSCGLDVSYSETPGDHTWEFWDSCIPGMLASLPI